MQMDCQLFQIVEYCQLFEIVEYCKLFELVEYCQLFEIAKWRTIQSAFGPSQGGCQQKSWEFWTVHNKDPRQ